MCFRRFGRLTLLGISAFFFFLCLRDADVFCSCRFSSAFKRWIVRYQEMQKQIVAPKAGGYLSFFFTWQDDWNNRSRVSDCYAEESSTSKWRLFFLVGASRMFVFVKDVVVDIFSCWNVLVLLFFFHDSQLRTNMTLRTNWVCWSDLVGFLERHLPYYMFPALHCQGPEELTMCCAMWWAQCIWPKGNAMWMEVRSFDQLYVFDFLILHEYLYCHVCLSF